MKCVGNNSPKSPGEIERKTYGTGGLVPVPDGWGHIPNTGRKLVDRHLESCPPTTNGVRTR